MSLRKYLEVSTERVLAEVVVEEATPGADFSIAMEWIGRGLRPIRETAIGAVAAVEARWLEIVEVAEPIRGAWAP